MINGFINAANERLGMSIAHVLEGSHEAEKTRMEVLAVALVQGPLGAIMQKTDDQISAQCRDAGSFGDALAATAASVFIAAHTDDCPPEIIKAAYVCDAFVNRVKWLGVVQPKDQSPQFETPIEAAWVGWAIDVASLAYGDKAGDWCAEVLAGV